MTDQAEKDLYELAGVIAQKMAALGTADPGIVSAKCAMLCMAATFGNLRGGRASELDLGTFLGVIITEMTTALGETQVRRIIDAAIELDCGGALGLQRVGEA